MEKFFNSPILDKIYETRCNEFETKILQKNKSNDFHESIKIEEQLTNLINKTVKNKKIREAILKKLNEYELSVSNTLDLWNKEYYKLGVIDSEKIMKEIRGV